MLKKITIFSWVGFFCFLGISEEIAYAAENFPDYAFKFKSYKRVDQISGTPLLEGKDLGVFKKFPKEELEKLDDKDISGLVSDRFETDADVQKHLVGKTMYGLTSKRVPYAMYFTADHKLLLRMADGRQEIGTWWTDQGKVCGQWSYKIHGGKTTFKTYYFIKGYSDYVIVEIPNKALYTVVHTKDGDPESLVEELQKTPK